MGATGEWNLDTSRFAREDRPAGATYLLEHATTRSGSPALERLLAEHGLVTRGGARRRPRRSSPRARRRARSPPRTCAPMLRPRRPDGARAPRARRASRSATAVRARNHQPADPHAPAALRPRPRRHRRARARLPRLPGHPRPRRRRGPAVAVHGALRRAASCGGRTPTRRSRSRSTRSSPTSSPSRDAARARQPQDADGPVFAEPWEAQAFALASRCTSAACSRGPSGRRRSPRRSSARRPPAIRTRRDVLPPLARGARAPRRARRA